MFAPGQLRLSDAIRHMRVQNNISARALSLQAGLSPSYVGKLEAGEIEPSVRAFAQLALQLRMTDREVALCVRMEAEYHEPLDSTHITVIPQV